MEIRVSSYGRAGDGCPDWSWIQPEVAVDIRSLGSKLGPAIGRGVVVRWSDGGKLVLVKVTHQIRGGAAYAVDGETVMMYPGQLVAR